MIYVLLTFTVLMGFCALAVDLARAQAAKTELHRLADAAARAAVGKLPSGNASAIAAAQTIAANTFVDGSTLTLNPSTDIFIGNWDSTNRVFTANATPTNAVRIIARRTTDENGSIPMIFAQLLGKPTLDIITSATAAQVTVNSATVTVSAHSNLWLAGQPTIGYQGSKPDPGWPSTTHPWEYDLANYSVPAGTVSPSGEPYDSPLMVTDSSGNPFQLAAGDTLTITNASGQVQNDPNGATHGANGTTSSGSTSTYDDDASHLSDPSYYGPPSNNSVTGDSENNISDIYVPIDSMIGVFLRGSTANTPPTAADNPNETLNFDSSLTINPDSHYGVTVTNMSQDYTSISPKLQQAFYVGSGQNSTSQQQSITVPANAGSFYLGTMDGHEWSNNVGSFTATVTQTRIELVQ
jgi:hypothetical protein